MLLKCGIVGLPNVGKSTLFNALSSAGVEAENFPFCTVEPNHGIVQIPDKRLDKISTLINPRSSTPAIVEFVDIAGLVKGASRGEGLGNQFLAHIRETHAIIHVIRCFKETRISHVHDTIDPIADLEIVETELLLADIETVSKIKLKAERAYKRGNKDLASKFEKLLRLEEELKKGIQGRNTSFGKEKDPFLKELQLITMKPCLYQANTGEETEENPFLNNLEDYLENKDGKILSLCNQIEAELVEFKEEERSAFLKEMDIEEPGLNKLIKASYNLLELFSFFTVVSKDLRAWTIKKGTLAPDAASEVHSDFKKGFIKADTIAYDDFIEYGGEIGSKAAGKLRSEGSDYIVQDGDVIYFKFNI